MVDLEEEAEWFAEENRLNRMKAPLQERGGFIREERFRAVSKLARASMTSC
jgi:hypothetical protein